MKLNDTDKMALNLTKRLRAYFQDRVDDFCIKDVYDIPGNQAFSIEFTAYRYFPIRIDYERGAFGACIFLGNAALGIESSQHWFDTADLNLFFKDLKEELELRIPDKYLEKNGWLSPP